MPTAPITPDLCAELNALLRFDPDDAQHGLKVHTTAAPELIVAMRHLHARGLIDQPDGGYLTPLGREAAAHARDLLGLLTTGEAAAVSD